MKIRIGNDFKTKWAITWAEEPEDFSNATDISLFFNIYDKKIELTKDVDYTITDNIIEIDCTPDICTILGVYNLELHYTKPNDDFIDGERRSAVDIDAFRIVGKSEKADSTQDVSIISDAVAIFLDIAYKKLEEIGANEDIRVTNENIRIDNEQQRKIDVSTAISNAEQATLNANSSATYANEQGAYAEEMSSHLPTIIDDYWHIWNFTTNQYESTGQYARGDSAIDGALVVQGKGQSAVNTMSQKAITDELVQLVGDISQEISNNVHGNYFSIHGKYINVGGSIDSTGGENSISDFILIDEDIESIKMRGRSQGIVALCAFCDIDKNIISVISGDIYNNVDVIINKEDFPTGAKYFIGNSGNRDTDYIHIHTFQSLTKYGSVLNPKGVKRANSLIISSSENDNSNTFKTMPELDVANNGKWFEINGKFIRATNGYVENTSVKGAVLTDLLDITNVEKIVIKGRSTEVHALCAFYDKDKRFISSIAGFLNSNKEITIIKEEFPEGTKYFRASGSTNVDSYLSLFTIESTYKDIKAIEERVVDLEKTNAIQTIGSISGIGSMGASLMYDGNGWLEYATREILNAECYNKAESGIGHPSYFAERLWRGTYCTDEEFENMDILAIQFANNSGLNSTEGLMLLDEYTENFDLAEANNPFLAYSSAQNLDYILKYWQKWCYEQKDNNLSKWYNTEHGKPFRVIFVTHWHDSRPYYSDAIREVAKRWGASVCEMDINIGFSINQPLFDGKHVSVIYAQDTQDNLGKIVGWHPRRGLEGEYIQKKMANIFAESVLRYFKML